jgi:hypothetical protein
MVIEIRTFQCLESFSVFYQNILHGVHAYYSMLEAFHLANYFNVKYDGSKAVSFSMVIF